MCSAWIGLLSWPGAVRVRAPQRFRALREQCQNANEDAKLELGYPQRRVDGSPAGSPSAATAVSSAVSATAAEAAAEAAAEVTLASVGASLATQRYKLAASDIEARAEAAAAAQEAADKRRAERNSTNTAQGLARPDIAGAAPAADAGAPKGAEAGVAVGPTRAEAPFRPHPLVHPSSGAGAEAGPSSPSGPPGTATGALGALAAADGEKLGVSMGSRCGGCWRGWWCLCCLWCADVKALCLLHETYWCYGVT